MPVDPNSLNDPEQVRNLLANALRRDEQKLALQCQIRLGEIEGAKYSSPLEREFWTAVKTAEEIKTTINGRTTRLTRTRQKVQRVGIEQCLIDWAASPTVTDGFETLVGAGKAHLTGEAIVVRHRNLFPGEVVRNAERKLLAKGVDLSALRAD